MFILNAGLKINNFIFYTHTNEGVFNWKDYEKGVTEAEFKAFMLLKNKPEGVTFKRGN